MALFRPIARAYNLSIRWKDSIPRMECFLSKAGKDSIPTLERILSKVWKDLGKIYQRKPSNKITPMHKPNKTTPPLRFRNFEAEELSTLMAEEVFEPISDKGYPNLSVLSAS